MRRSLLLALRIVGVVSVLAACSSPPPPDPAPSLVGQTSSAIINGQADTTHHAVVMIVLTQGTEGGLCSGTIVKTDVRTHIGWIVTAAHCVEVTPVYVLQGNDVSAPGGVLRYDVIDYAADPRYGGQVGSPYDFAVIRIAGVDESTPTIPLVGSPDGLANGTSVVSVGYGRTTLGAAAAGAENTTRRRVSKTLSQVGQSIGYDMQSDGICQGDSGGPVLATSGGIERVVGVHSYVQGSCNGFGVSSRVSVGATFLNAQLAKASPTEDCGLCGKIANSGNGKCATASRNCLADKDCGGYYECLSSGRSKATCLAKFPKAEGPFNVAANCMCTLACTTSCKGSLDCVNVPACGYKLAAGSCKTCTESSCCDETLACAGDGTCYVCLKANDNAPECATNAARKKMATCVASKCKEECVGSGLDNGAEPVVDVEPVTEETNPAAPVAGTTTTTSSCSVTPRQAGQIGSQLAFAVAGLAALGASIARRRRR